MPKTYSDTYLYKQYIVYDKKLFEFIMKADRIDTSANGFNDIMSDLRRRGISNALTKVLTSNNTVLGINGTPLPKAFKAFVAKDIRNDKKDKLFIDVTDCIELKEGMYECKRIEWLASYAISGMTAFIYTKAENKIVGNASLTKDGCTAFVRCFSYIIDRMYKISSMQAVKRRVEYIAALYYQCCILGKDFTKSFDSIKGAAMKITDIESRDAQVVDIMISEDCFYNLDHFIDNINRIFKFKDLTTSAVVDKWMGAFGTGTVFALEYFPAFSAMLTNTYVGGYLDQQLTIEKVTGTSMVTFTKTILQIGAAVV